MKKVLFVCYGNICRSPAGEGILKTLVQKENLQDKIFVHSAGIHGFHIGEKPCDRMQNHALKRGYILDSRARKITSSDLEEFDYIITMDNENYYDVRSLDYEEKYLPKVKKMVKFLNSNKFDEVPDPYYGGADGFEHVLDILEEAIPNLLEQLKKEI